MSISLRKETQAGIKCTAAASLIIALGGLILLAFLARKLDKSDFGLMAIVNILTIFSVELVDMGIGQAIIQRQQATQSQLSSLFWVNLSLGIIVCLCLYHIAPLVSSFYDNKELTPLIQIISLIFIFNGLSSQFQAIFQRDFKFKLIAIIDIISFGVYFILTLSLVIMGYEVYALVWGSFGRNATRGIILFVMGSRDNLPKFSFSFNEIKIFLNFGAFRLGAFIINYFNKRLDSILIGKLLGMELLGVYDMYQRILTQPISFFGPIKNKVLFSLFSKISKDPQKGKTIFLTVFNLLNSVHFPIFIFLIVGAGPILLLFLGETWLDNINVFRILAAFFMIRTIGSFTGSVMVACGKANWSFYSNIAMLCITPIMIYLGSSHLMLGVATALLTMNILVQIPRYNFIVKRILPVSWKEYLVSILRPLFVSIFAGIVISPLVLLGLNPIYASTIMCICFVSLILIASYFYNKNFLLEINRFIPSKFRIKIK